jgi:hypothetical protein
MKQEMLNVLYRFLVRGKTNDVARENYSSLIRFSLNYPKSLNKVPKKTGTKHTYRKNDRRRSVIKRW